MRPSPSINSKEMHEETINEETEPITITKYVIFKNLVAISVGTLLLLSTADVLEVFQSTLNVEGGVGVASIAVQNASSVIAALFLPKYLIKRFGNKAVIVFSMTAFVPFFVVNYYPMYPLMILSSFLFGMGTTLYMGAIDPYVNDLATCYNKLLAKENEQIGAIEATQSDDTLPENNVSYLPYQTVDIGGMKQVEMSNPLDVNILHESPPSHMNHHQHCSFHSCTSQLEAKSKEHYSESTTSRFFGIYSMIYQTCFIWGSLMGYYVLQSGYTQKPQFAIMNDTCTCGAGYCVDTTVCLEQNLVQPPTETRNILISICLGLCIVAGIVVIAFFSDLKLKDKNVSPSLQMLLATFRQTQKRNHLLLIPLTMHNGMSRTFFQADFTKSYVGCAWGIEHVGLVTACGGGTVAFASTVSGWLVRYTGRRPIFATVAALNMGLNVLLLMWRPDPAFPEMLFVAAVMWSIVYGTFYTQTKAFYGVLFKEDEEAAFGAYQVWQCIGSCLYLAYSNFICNDVKIYILTVFCALGIIGYFLVEKSHALESKIRTLGTSGNKDADFKPEDLTDTFVNGRYFSQELETYF